MNVGKIVYLNSNLGNKLTNDTTNRLTSIGYDADKVALKVNIDGAGYPVPTSLFGENRFVKGIGVFYNPTLGKNVIQVNWWADGVDHTDYISFD